MSKIKLPLNRLEALGKSKSQHQQTTLVERFAFIAVDGTKRYVLETAHAMYRSHKDRNRGIIPASMLNTRIQFGINVIISIYRDKTGMYDIVSSSPINVDRVDYWFSVPIRWETWARTPYDDISRNYAVIKTVLLGKKSCLFNEHKSSIKIMVD